MDGVADDRLGRSGRHTATEMTKEEAQLRARSWKRGLWWAAAIGFVVLWQAAAHHVTGVTSRSTPSTTQQQNSGGFVPSQTPTQSQGFGFGSGGNAQPLTQTSVS
ncbi:MAG: hypothetical protein M0Z66_14520 [Thermaerobacter sp.]|nr:hypothetical protein [Thermaerobacter sp.]